MIAKCRQEINDNDRSFERGWIIAAIPRNASSSFVVAVSCSKGAGIGWRKKEVRTIRANSDRVNPGHSSGEMVSRLLVERVERRTRLMLFYDDQFPVKPSGIETGYFKLLISNKFSSSRICQLGGRMINNSVIRWFLLLCRNGIFVFLLVFVFSLIYYKEL